MWNQRKKNPGTSGASTTQHLYLIYPTNTRATGPPLSIVSTRPTLSGYPINQQLIVRTPAQTVRQPLQLGGPRPTVQAPCLMMEQARHIQLPGLNYNFSNELRIQNALQAEAAADKRPAQDVQVVVAKNKRARQAKAPNSNVVKKEKVQVTNPKAPASVKDKDTYGTPSNPGTFMKSHTDTPSSPAFPKCVRSAKVDAEPKSSTFFLKSEPADVDYPDLSLPHCAPEKALPSNTVTNTVNQILASLSGPSMKSMPSKVSLHLKNQLCNLGKLEDFMRARRSPCTDAVVTDLKAAFHAFHRQKVDYFNIKLNEMECRFQGTYVLEVSFGGPFRSTPPVKIQFTDDYPGEIPSFLGLNTLASQIPLEDVRNRFEFAIRVMKRALANKKESVLRIDVYILTWLKVLYIAMSKSAEAIQVGLPIFRQGNETFLNNLWTSSLGPHSSGLSGVNI